LSQRARALGYDLTDNVIAQVFAMFKRRADQIGEVDDAELIALIEQVTDIRVGGGKNVVVN
jgi:2-isopropylmalate synthase